jgi:cleavage and polyadenylation specificity factor subunit 5
MANRTCKVDCFASSGYIVAATDPCRKHQDTSMAKKLERMKKRFDECGTIHSVEAVILTHSHHHPHIVLLEVDYGGHKVFRLPGGKCPRDAETTGESEVESLKRKLRKKLFSSVPEGEPLPFRIGELLSTWTRPNFETLLYPYRPPHVTREKEVRSIYLVHLDPDVTFTVPSHLRVVIAPLFDLHDNAARYGHVVAGVPHALSRVQINYC